MLPTGQAAVFTEPAGGELVDARRDKIIAGGDGFRVFWWGVEIKIPNHERAVGAHPRNGAISARRHLFERGHADIIHGRDAGGVRDDTTNLTQSTQITAATCADPITALALSRCLTVVVRAPAIDVVIGVDGTVNMVNAIAAIARQA